MKLYNTASKTLEVVVPLNPPTITVYTCGPTVYDYAHIGHWFTYVRADLLIRSLNIAGLAPKWVMNITDVGHLTSDADEGEDKLEKGARREGKTAWQVAEFYTDDFLSGMKQLNILQPDHIVKATDHIADQIALIQKLEVKGFSYTIDDGVYFDTSKFGPYADFARLELDDQQGSGRVVANPQKRSAPDFALWKFSPGGQKRDMEWDSPWGKGFPGWHIECSAMSMKYLGETIDLHTGGIDHVPVHHTNEIAQSEAATGKRFVHTWLHSNHVMVNGEKISKSLGNGIRLQQVADKGISPEAIRLHILESHYRSQSKFSWNGLTGAQNRLHAYQSMADQKWQAHNQGAMDIEQLEKATQAIRTALLDDLNTPAVLTILSQLEATIDNGGINTECQEAYGLFLNWLDDALGLKLAETKDISLKQKQLLQQRQIARDTKDWLRSDKLRDELQSQGIGVRDTTLGQIWFRVRQQLGE